MGLPRKQSNHDNTCVLVERRKKVLTQTNNCIVQLTTMLKRKKPLHVLSLFDSHPNL